MRHSSSFRCLATILGICIFAATGCSSLKINTTASPQARFAEYESFSIAPSQSIDDPRIEDIIAFVISRELRNRGLIEDSDGTDLVVTVDGQVGSREQMATRLGYAVETWQGETTVYTVSRGVPMGSLVINVIDRKQGSVVWQAEARTGLKPEADPTTRLERLEAAVAKMIRRYPGTP